MLGTALRRECRLSLSCGCRRVGYHRLEFVMQRRLPTIPPHRGTVATAMQPDYRKWEAVRVGMSRSEVTSLLGPPLTGRELRPNNHHQDPNYPIYGFISYPALPHQWEMRFLLGFKPDDRVWWKCDPFGGSALSRTGKPSKPKWITPQCGSRMKHFPRVLDIRWFPSSGVYPIVYELEVGLSALGSDKYRGYVHGQRYGQPYALISFPGAQPGRIRVRGRNARGVGHWSDYVDFTFEV